MAFRELACVYFSPTGGTKKVIRKIGTAMSGKSKLPIRSINVTLPEARKSALTFSKDQILLFALPVYAGRLPNVLLPWLNTIEGNGATAVPVVVYGNRSYDDALIEWRDLLIKAGFRVIGAGAFVAEHAFSTTLGGGRPDEKDMQKAICFGEALAEKYVDGNLSPVHVPGTPYPYSGYYQPRDGSGNPLDIRKVTPKTAESCIDCKRCARLCPMGSLSYQDVSLLTGICIKCCACVKGCPVGAKYFDDPAFLYHKEDLEAKFTRRAEPEFFV